MKLRTMTLGFVFLLSIGSCAQQETTTPADGAWVGTITTEGNVTTVVNESGSAWGGTASVVEELSIGVDTGDEPYMFGSLVGVDATDSRIYVADNQVRAIRVYDWQGKHLFDIGREGQGPGEFEGIRSMEIDPAGRVVVQDRGRVAVFDLDGNVLDTWAYRASGARPLAVAADGTTYVPTVWTEGEERVSGVVAVASDGTELERIAGTAFDAAPWGLFATKDGAGRGGPVPFAPAMVWAMLPSRTMVEGLSDTYRFHMWRPDGSTIVVERAVELPSVPEEEAQWQTARLTAWLRVVDPEWDWNVNAIPERKPAFRGFLGDRYGRLWVVRTLHTEGVSDCDPDPLATERPRSCWRSVIGLDVFEEETGRFLGQADVPALDFRSVPPAFLDDRVITVVQDDAGTIMVKRYRLVLPGEEGQ